MADVAQWFGDIPGYSAFDLSTGVPTQPIFLRERGTIEGSSLDGSRARAVNYESVAESTSLVRQGFTATAIFIATPADEQSQLAAIDGLVTDAASIPAGWESEAVETRTIGANDYFVIDSRQPDQGVNTRSWVAVVGSYLVTVTFDWTDAASAQQSAVAAAFSSDEVAAQTASIESLLASVA